MLRLSGGLEAVRGDVVSARIQALAGGEGEGAVRPSAEGSHNEYPTRAYRPLRVVVVRVERPLVLLPVRRDEFARL